MPLPGAVLLTLSLLAATGPLDKDASARRDLSYYHYLLSRQALGNHDFKGALTEMEAAREADPASAELAMELARLHLDVGDPIKAAEAARVAADLQPVTSAPKRLLAEALFTAALREGSGEPEFQAASAALDELGRLEPNDADVPLDQARLLISRGRMEEALGPIGRHLEIQPGSEEGSLMAAQVLIRLARYDQATDLLTNAIRVHPQRPVLRVALMESLEAQQKYAEAAQIAGRLIDAGFESARMRYALARLKQKMGDHAGAAEELGRLSALMQERPTEYPPAELAEVELRRLGALVAADRLDDATSSAAEMARRFPEDHRFVQRQAEALVLRGREQEAEALFAGGQSEQAGRLSQVYLAAGARRERAADLPQAERLLRRAIELDTHNASALNYLGYMMADRGERLDEAIGLIERALQEEPGNGAYLDSLGWAWFRKGDHDRARRELERAAQAMDDEPEIHEHLGEVYFTLGLMPQAIAAWQKALELGSENAGRIRERMSEARKGLDRRE